MRDTDQSAAEYETSFRELRNAIVEHTTLHVAKDVQKLGAYPFFLFG